MTLPDLQSDAEAAASALGQVPPEPDEQTEQTDAGEPGAEERQGRILRQQLQGIVAAVDLVAVRFMGEPMRLTDSEKETLVEGWYPFAESLGGIELPPWAVGALATGMVYGPKWVDARRQAADAARADAAREVPVDGQEGT